MKEDLGESSDSNTVDRKIGGSWINRNRKKSLALLTLLIFFGPYVYSRMTSQSHLVQIFSQLKKGEQRRSIDSSAKFKIAVMNIAHGRGQAGSNWSEAGARKRKRISEIARFLKRLDADIVVLNEVDFNSTWSGHQNQAAAIAEQAGYSYRMEQRNLDFRFAYGSFSFGNAVLSRLPIANAKYLEYPGVNEWEKRLCGKKGGSIVTIKCSPTTFLQLFPVHTEHRDEDVRVGSVEQLLRHRSELPIIYAGDFNSAPTGFPGSSEGVNGKNALDEMRTAGDLDSRPLELPTLGEFTFPSTKPATTIDWVFVSNQLAIVDYRVVQTEAELSDHFPILATLKVVDSQTKIEKTE